MKTLFSQLSWSHFQRVLKVSNENARIYYLKEAAENTWSVRTLDRNIFTLYYDRLIASADKELIEKEMTKNKPNATKSQRFYKKSHGFRISQSANK